MPTPGYQAIRKGIAMETNDKIDILITGVGGQGVVLASDIIGEVAIAGGYDVKKTDTLGMAQRGGSVTAHIRMANQVASPLIQPGEANFMLAFEKLEAVRWADMLNPLGTAIINNLALPPVSAGDGSPAYPDDEKINEELYKHVDEVLFIEGSSIAEEMGNSKVLNVVMLGSLSMLLPFSPDTWKEVIRQHLPEKIVDLNLSAFSRGRKEMLHALDVAPFILRAECEHEHEDGQQCGGGYG
jgi:indolepyruvate ferredoxin oxidoreductase beta subunit